MIIRQATRLDESQVRQLFLELYEYHTSDVLNEPIKSFVRVENPQQYAQETVADYFSEQYFLFVAEKDAKIVGYICGKVNDRKQYQIHPEGFIEDWFVTQSERGNGVGKLLYDQLLRKFQELSCKTVALEVFYDNQNAVNLYKTLGFSEDAMYMKKSIDL